MTDNDRVLREAAQAVVDRWDSPAWKDLPATATYINALRAALPSPFLQEGVGMSDLRFGFTGTRFGMTPAQQASLTKFLSGGTGELHHGDCVGADAEAHDIADACGYAIVIHPPTEAKLRAWRVVPRHMMRSEKTFMARNRDIVTETVALIATPSEAEEQPRGGTWSTVRYAKKIGHAVVLIRPDGTIEQTDGRAP